MRSNPRGDQVVHTSIALGIVATIAVILRLLARQRTKSSFAADDLLVILSLIPQYGMLAIGHIAAQSAGMGLPVMTLSPSQISLFLKMMMSGLLTYSFTITTVKISILVLYRRIFITTAFKKKTLIVGVACLAWFFITIFTNLFQCRPFKAAFDPQLLFTNQCVDLQTYYWGIAGSNLALDVVILFLPLHMVWRLKISKGQKAMLSGIFMLGGVVCIAGAMRIVSIGVLAKEDMTLSMASEYLWTQVEPATAIICACVVTYRPLFANININLSKLSSLFSRGSSAASNDDSSNPHFLWPAARGLHGNDTLRLNSKAAKNSLHFINVELQPVDSEQERFYTNTVIKGPSTKPIPRAKTSKSRQTYDSPPFYVTEERAVVVSPFA